MIIFISFEIILTLYEKRYCGWVDETHRIIRLYDYFIWRLTISFAYQARNLNVLYFCVMTSVKSWLVWAKGSKEGFNFNHWADRKTAAQIRFGESTQKTSAVSKNRKMIAQFKVNYWSEVLINIQRGITRSLTVILYWWNIFSHTVLTCIDLIPVKKHWKLCLVLG